MNWSRNLACSDLVSEWVWSCDWSWTDHVPIMHWGCASGGNNQRAEQARITQSAGNNYGPQVWWIMLLSWQSSSSWKAGIQLSWQLSSWWAGRNHAAHLAIFKQLSRQESSTSVGPGHVTLHALITWLIMRWSRGWSCTDRLTDHALVTWLSCTNPMADHTLIILSLVY